VRSRTSASIAAASPETTVVVALLIAAIDSRSPNRARCCSTSPPPSSTEAIAPVPASLVSAPLRSATTLAASARESAPATQAAPISPWLWPMTAGGDQGTEQNTDLDVVVGLAAGTER